LEFRLQAAKFVLIDFCRLKAGLRTVRLSNEKVSPSGSLTVSSTLSACVSLDQYRTRRFQQ